MNDNDINLTSGKKNTYRATTNLNTAIENPQMNMNSVVGVNIQNVDEENPLDNVYSSNLNNDSLSNLVNENNFMAQMNNNDDYLNIDVNNNVNINNQNNNYLDNNVSNSDNKFVTSSNLNDSIINDNSNFVSNQVSYEPVMEDKKKSRRTLKISKELQVMFFIVFILFIFILLIPYIYDFFKDLELAITTR